MKTRLSEPPFVLIVGEPCALAILAQSAPGGTGVRSRAGLEDAHRPGADSRVLSNFLSLSSGSVQRFPSSALPGESRGERRMGRESAHLCSLGVPLVGYWSDRGIDPASAGGEPVAFRSCPNNGPSTKAKRRQTPTILPGADAIMGSVRQVPPWDAKVGAGSQATRTPERGRRLLPPQRLASRRCAEVAISAGILDGQRVDAVGGASYDVRGAPAFSLLHGALQWRKPRPT